MTDKLTGKKEHISAKLQVINSYRYDSSKRGLSHYDINLNLKEACLTMRLTQIQKSLRFSWFCVFFVSKDNPFWLLFLSQSQWGLCESKTGTSGNEAHLHLLRHLPWQLDLCPPNFQCLIWHSLLQYSVTWHWEHRLSPPSSGHFWHCAHTTSEKKRFCRM